MISLRGARQMTPCEALPRFEGPSHVLGVEVTGSVADASLFLAYSIISAYLVWVRFKHADVTMELNRILYLFQLFIAACGLSHLSMMVNMIAATLGSSWFSMLMKAAAAIVSVYTAFVLPSATREAANRIYTKIQNQLVKEKRLESEKATALVTRCIADHVNKATSGIEAIQRTTQAVVKYTKGFRASAISIPLEAEHVNRHSASASRASVTLGDEMFFVTRSFTENKDAKPNLGAVKASESSNLGLISAFQNDNARDQFLREVRHVLHEGGIRKISTMAAAFLLGPNAPRALLTQLGRRIRQQRQNTKGSSVTISPEQDWACWYAVRIRVPLQLVEDQYTDSTFWMPTNIPDEYLFNNNTLSKPLKSGNSRRSSNAAFERLSDCRWADSQATVDSSDSSQVKADSFTYAIMLVCDPIEKDSLQDAHGVLFDVAQQLSTTLQRTHVLQQERDQLKQLAEMEKQKRQANDTFLSMISHELRTPLHAILGYSELLQERIESEDLKEYLHTIAASGSSLCELLNDIIDLTKYELGQVKPERVQFSLRTNIEEVVTLLAHQCDGNYVNLNYFMYTYKFDKSYGMLNDDLKSSWSDRQNLEPPENMFGDPVRLRQVLINLVGNASKFTEKGSIVVSSTAVRVRFEDYKSRPELIDPKQYLTDDVQNLPFCWDSRRHIHDIVYCFRGSESNSQATTLEGLQNGTSEHDRVVVVIEVADTGIGMDREVGEKIFEKFNQGDETSARRFGGTGLGLSIVKSLMEMFGGDIMVTSKAGKGASFFLCFCVEAAQSSCEFCLNETSSPIDDSGFEIQPMHNDMKKFTERAVVAFVEFSKSDSIAAAQRLLETGAGLATSVQGFTTGTCETVPSDKCHLEATSNPGKLLAEKVKASLQFPPGTFTLGRKDLRSIARYFLSDEDDPIVQASPTSQKVRLLVVNLASLCEQEDVDTVNSLVSNGVSILLLAPSKQAAMNRGIVIPSGHSVAEMPNDASSVRRHYDMTSTGTSSLEPLTTRSCDTEPPSDEIDSMNLVVDNQQRLLRSMGQGFVPIHIATKPLTLRKVIWVLEYYLSNCLSDIKDSAHPLHTFSRSYMYGIPEENDISQQSQDYLGPSNLRPYSDEARICDEGAYLSTNTFISRDVLELPEPRKKSDLRVLVVEDNVANLQYTCLLLEKLNISYDTAISGEAAISKTKRASPKFDIMFLDLNVAGMHGISICKHILQYGDFPETQRPWIAAMTASVLQKDKDACANVGVSYFLPKPFRINEFSQVIDAYRQLEEQVKKASATNESRDPELRPRNLSP